MPVRLRRRADFLLGFRAVVGNPSKLPGRANRALIAALRSEAPVYPEAQLGADDDWLDGPTATPSPTPADAAAVADWLE